MIFGRGGGYNCLASSVELIDSIITKNTASGSGGGIYYSGNGLTQVNAPLLKNCLVTQNTANHDGGGVSSTWLASPLVQNCTIVSNKVTGSNVSNGYGGGVFAAYDSTMSIVDSIIWSNLANKGSQVAVAGGDPYEPRPSTMFINNSTIQNMEKNEFTLINPNSSPVIRSGFNSSSLAGNDDESTGLVDIGFQIDFYGKSYSQLYVNNNGNVTFDANMLDFTPFGLTSEIPTSIIAPFFADVDTTDPNVNDPNNNPKIVTYGTGTVGGRKAFGVNWIDVGYYTEHYDKLNSFQLIIIDRSDRKAGDFDIEFNYRTINWETGDASEGENGYGGQSAHAGFSNGTGNVGTYYELFGSGANGYFLDNSPTGLVHDSLNSSVKGRYIFAVFDGSPAISVGDPVYVDPLSSLDTYNKQLWADTAGWDPESGNIVGDPLFVTGYFLSQESCWTKRR